MATHSKKDNNSTTALTLTVPASGESQIVTAPASGLLILAFDQVGADINRVENDLVFIVKRSTIVVKNFFELVEGESLPVLKLLSGETLDAIDFLRYFNPEIDLTIVTLPGNECGQPPSGGLSAYDSGDTPFTESIDRLGSLEGVIGLWSNASTLSMKTKLVNTSISSAAEEMPLFPPPPPAPDPTPTPRYVIGSGRGEQFFEKNLINGTCPDGTNLVKALAIPDGLTLDISSWVNAGNAIYTLQGTSGFLTYNVSTGELTYTLTGSRAHSFGSSIGYDDFGTIKVTYNNDNVFDATVSVTITDDMPVVTLGGAASPVISGGEYIGTLGLNFGADGAAGTDSLTVNVTVNGETATVTGVQAGVEFAVIVDGVSYGTMKLDPASNSFVFKPAANIANSGDVSIGFQVGATDADGDTVWTGDGSDFGITIEKPTDPTGGENIANDLDMQEKNLADGTDSNPAMLTKTIPLAPGWSVKTDEGGWLETSAGSDVYTLQGDSGFLTWDGTTLSYTLDSSFTHATGLGANTGMDDFGAIKVTDNNNNVVDATVSVKITDDMPVVTLGGAASPVISGGEYIGTLGLNFGADGAAGTDSLTVKVTVNGETATIGVQAGVEFALVVNSVTCGTMVLNPDTNSFVFKPAANIANSGDVSIGFQVGATDADGDTVWTGNGSDFVIVIEKPTDPTGGENIAKDLDMQEKNLADGTDSNLAMLTKTIPLALGWSVKTDEGGWLETSIGSGVYTLQGDSGFLTWDGTTLSYTLDSSFTHATGLGANTGMDDFGAIKVTDNNNNVVDATVSVKITDDIPVVTLDGAASPVTSGGEYIGTLGLNFGADGAASANSLVVKVTLNGESATIADVQAGVEFALVVNSVTCGTMVLNPDTNSFVFKPAANIANSGDVSIGFQVGATDADGDTVWTGNGSDFVIVIEKPTDPTGGENIANDLDMQEKNLADGTDFNPAMLTKTIPLALGWSVKTDEGGWLETSIGSGVYTLQGDSGFLTWDGTTLSYTLNGSFTHATGLGANTGMDDFGAIKVTDNNNNVVDATVSVKITDDIPVVTLDGAASPVISGGEYIGTLGLNFGADGAAGTDSLTVKVTVNGETATIGVQAGVEFALVVNSVTCGTMVLNPDTNSFVFKPAANIANSGDVSIGFQVGATDADGDTVWTGNGSDFVIVIEKPTDPTGGENIAKDLDMQEKNLADGTDSNLAMLTKTIPLALGWSVKTDEGGWLETSAGSGIYTLQGDSGFLTWDGTTLSYTLDSSFTHATGLGANTGMDDFGAIKVTDNNNNVVDATVSVKITDDIPVVTLDGAASPVTSGGEYIGTLGLNFGADGAASANSLVVKVTLNGETATVTGVQAGVEFAVIVDGVSYGTMKLDPASNSFVFKPAANIANSGDVSIGFQVGATDADGDTVWTGNGSDFVIVIEKPTDPTGGENIANDLDMQEKNLADGTDSNPAMLTKTIPLAPGWSVKTDEGGWLETSIGSGVYTLQGDSGFLTWDGTTLSYTLNGSFTHATGLGANTGMDDFGAIKVTDNNNNVVDATVSVKITDDMPVVTLGGAASPVISGGEYIGTLGLNFGADGAAGTDSLTVKVTVNGETATIGVQAGVEFALVVNSVTCGTMVLNPDTNSFVFKPAANIANSGDVSIGFQVGATDADGDTVWTGNGSDFVIVIEKPTDPTGGENIAKDLDMQEKNLADGTDSNLAMLTKTIPLALGWSVKTDEGGWLETSAGSGIYTLQGDSGFLTWDGTTLSYTLDSSLTHATGLGANTGMDDFGAIKVTDNNNNVVDAQLSVSIIDDTPVINANGIDNLVFDATVEGMIGVITSMSFGADKAGGYVQVNGNTMVYAEATGEYRYTDATGTYRIDDVGNVYFNSAQNKDLSLNVVISLHDGDGDKIESVPMQAQVNKVLLEVQVTSGMVHEAALPNGTSVDWTGDGSGSVSKENLTAKGTFTVSESVDSITIALGGQDTGITLASLAGPISLDIAGGIFTVTALGSNSYSYSFTLHTSQQHVTTGGATGEALSKNITISVSEDGKTASETGSITIVNDEVVAANPANYTINMPEVDGVAITLVLDLSGSMNEIVSGTTTRLALAKSALSQLLDKYESVYPEDAFFEINLATFSSANVGGHSLTFTSIADAKAFINSLTAGGGTSFRDGLNAAESLIKQSVMRNPTYEQKVYFITDGEPSAGYGVPDSWKVFVQGEYKEILGVHAIGVGPGATNATAAGKVQEALAPGDSGDIYIAATNEVTLAEKLTETVQGISGDLFDLDFSGSSLVTGADGGFRVMSVVVDNVTYTIPEGGSTSIDINSGLTIHLNSDGTYTLQVKVNQITFDKEIHFTIMDKDGDIARFDQAITFDFHTRDPYIIAYDNYGQPQYLSNVGNIYDLRLLGYNELPGNGFPINSVGADYENTLSQILANPHVGVTAASNSGIIIRANGNIDAYMPLEADGTQLTMQELYTSAGYSPSRYKDAGFITLPTITVHSSSKVVVRWYWDGGINHRDLDAAFWVLIDARGQVVKSAKFANGDTIVNINTANLHISIDAPGDYKIMLIAADGVQVGQTEQWDAYLSFFGAYVISDKIDQIYYEGNVISDASSTGAFDESSPRKGLFLTEVKYNGIVYEFGVFNAVTIDVVGGGKMLVYKDGTYKFFGPAGSLAPVDLVFEYTVSNSAGHTDTATLHFGEIFQAHDNIGTTIVFDQSGSDYDFRLAFYSAPAGGKAPTGNGSVTVHGTTEELIMREPNMGVATTNTAQILIRATGNIDAYMPREANGTQLTMKELYAAAGYSSSSYKDAGFITLPTITVNTSSTVVIRWYWDGGMETRDVDAAFWVLIDARGQVVKFAKFANGNAIVNNNAFNLHISIDAPGDYKIMLIAADGVQVGQTEEWDAYLAFYGAYVVADKTQQQFFQGNLLTDKSPAGVADISTAAGLTMKSVLYDGVNYTFEHGAVIIDVNDGGRLLVYVDGTYKYFGTVGHPEMFQGLDLEYTITNSAGQLDSAMLHLRDEEHTFRGGINADSLIGTDGDDYISGGKGADQLQGGSGNDIIYGGSGNDLLYGGSGDDKLYGGTNNDTIYGGIGNDTIFGDEGDDLIFGGTGTNYLTGGDGADTFAFESGSLGGIDHILDFSTEQVDCLNFTDLFDGTESGRDSFFASNIKNISIDGLSRELGFTIQTGGGGESKVVDITFKANDTGYNQLFVDYQSALTGQQEAVLMEFLKNITTL